MAVNKNKNGWYCSFYYTDYTNKRIRKKREGFKTRREALDYQRDFLDFYNSNSDIRFTTLVKRYLKDQSKRLSPATLYVYEHNIKTHILPYFKEYKVNEITAPIIRQFQNNLMERDYTAIYIKKLYTTLKILFSYAVKYAGLKNNPIALVDPIKLPTKKKLEFYTLDEFKKFMAVVDSEHYIIIFNLLFYAGLRIGELLALTPKDIEPQENAIHINRAIDKHGNIKAPKTETSKRTIYTSSHIIKMLVDYVERARVPADCRIFEFSQSALRYANSRYSKRANIKTIRLHDFRHSHASLLINKGVPPIIISKQLGHANITTTLNIYSHLYPNEQKKIITLLEDLE